MIKWKEIFDLLEAATDRCEDVANLLEGYNRAISAAKLAALIQ